MLVQMSRQQTLVRSLTGGSRVEISLGLDDLSPILLVSQLTPLLQEGPNNRR
jgi:hypothetical protein